MVQRFYGVSPIVEEGNGQRESAIQAVRGAGNSGVVGPDRHLDPVEDRFVVDAVAD